MPATFSEWATILELTGPNPQVEVKYCVEALFQEITVEREALNTLLKQIKARQMTLPGVTPGGWSVKDILAHVVGWQGRILKWHEAEQRGETPAVPAPGLRWGDLKRFNEMIYQEHRRRSLKAVLLDYEVFHNRMIALIEATSDADLLAVGRFKWMGPPTSVRRIPS